MITTFYAPQYGVNTNLSMRKLPLVAEEIETKGLAVLRSPQGVENIEAKLKKIHNAEYVNAVMDGIGKLSEASGFEWSPKVRDSILYNNAGLLEAVENVLETETYGHRLSIGSSVSNGFHHAMPKKGEAFCTFNGLALVASELTDKKIFVLDADTHQGNGTKEFTKTLKNLYNFSIFSIWFDDKNTVERNWDRQVFDWEGVEAGLCEAFTTISEVNPSVIIYQAGMDAWENDCLGCGYLTEAELLERDRMVFEFAKEIGIPIVFVLAGGYNDEETIRLHVNTYEIANEVFFGELNI